MVLGSTLLVWTWPWVAEKSWLNTSMAVKLKSVLTTGTEMLLVSYTYSGATPSMV